MVIFWEGYVYIELIACCMANNLFFKARDELTGTENQWEVFAFAAFESNAFFEAFKVDQSGIAVLSSSFYVGQTGVSFSHAVELSIYVSSHDSFNSFFCFDAFIVFNGNFWFYSNGSFEAEAFALFYLQVRNVCTVNWFDICFFYCCFVCRWVYHVDCIVIEEFFTVHFFDHCLWSFTFTEAWQCNRFYFLFIRFVQRILELFLANAYYQFYCVVLKFVYRSQTHFIYIPFFFLCRIRIKLS